MAFAFYFKQNMKCEREQILLKILSHRSFTASSHFVNEKGSVTNMCDPGQVVTPMLLHPIQYFCNSKYFNRNLTTGFILINPKVNKP